MSRAITMWDFSWLERRWPGAGYEDVDQALDELVDRGYDAVRIDPYPHLLAQDGTRSWRLLPVWDQNDWGAPGPVDVRVRPHLEEFVGKCAERGVLVALSSWFRPDTTDARMAIHTPDDLAGVWSTTLDVLAEAGLSSSILYVDLCNEYPLPLWAPWLRQPSPSRQDPEVHRWMTDSLATLRTAHPDVPACFSFATELRSWREQDVSCHDLLEPHIWMGHPEVSDFYDRVPYDLENCVFDPEQWRNLVANGETLYRADPEHWQRRLIGAIEDMAEWSRSTGKPLVTTESWAVVNYKDWPGADWGWIRELCELGVRTAAATGRWAALCTSNFAGPQFRGMWRDVAWHRRLTDHIRGSPGPMVPPSSADTEAAGTEGSKDE